VGDDRNRAGAKDEGALKHTEAAAPAMPSCARGTDDGGSKSLRVLQAIANLEGEVPCAVYASDIPYEGPMPPANVSRGEVAATQTRSGVMDSLLRSSLLRFSPLIPGVNYPMTYVGARNTFFCWHVEVCTLKAASFAAQPTSPRAWHPDIIPYQLTTLTHPPS